MPYQEDFEQTRMNGTPKYLADQDGAFEVHTCRERTGHCLEQVITEKPTPWGPLPNPFTLTGNSKWTDYRIESEVLLTEANEAALLGRIDSADVFRDGKAQWPSGYIFELNKEGTWNLLSAAFKIQTRTLASGKVSATSGWRRLALEFHGNQIAASIDGKNVAMLRDSTHKNGMFALGSGWGHVQFDNLKVTP